ncbi:MAG: hypothetical protein ABII82_20170, partial [Verrucomicrobiota bacterium]
MAAMDPRNPADWIALNLLPGLGPATLLRLVEQRGNPADVAYRLPVAELARSGRGRPPDVAALAGARRGLERRAEREALRCKRSEIQVICWDAPDYPEPLREIAVPPLVLYVRGRLTPGLLRVGV